MGWIFSTVGPTEGLAKLQVVGVIKKQIKLRLNCYVLTILRGFSHLAIRCYSFSFIAVSEVLTPNTFRWCRV